MAREATKGEALPGEAKARETLAWKTLAWETKARETLARETKARKAAKGETTRKTNSGTAAEGETLALLLSRRFYVLVLPVLYFRVFPFIGPPFFVGHMMPSFQTNPIT
ncbi:hypothetical protein TcarDRAFT_2211 [Thermosinus carboxydivorans Nor1]|uniref:Uncharacterized protein n=1 Tax=Thermosinus carboxydivorans Nor1 TaxID=401526 RepID=A1HMS6_9FIRM|nr:hypothetical protein TcarDRAFT_2211 [Thermosinus carboxydivorans Nor1]